MMQKQHNRFRSKLLAVLFLFFNCVCAAAPAAKLTDNNLADALSLKIGSCPVQTEEETHVASGYVNYVSHFSVRAQSFKQNPHFRYNKYAAAISVVESNASILNAGTLPLPGNYAFLFRYNLF